jgi:hypothetical protein
MARYAKFKAKEESKSVNMPGVASESPRKPLLKFAKKKKKAFKAK